MKSESSSPDAKLYSAFVLAHVLRFSHTTNQESKLTCAMYLAQHRCKVVLYDYGLYMGHVVSSELAADFQQLRCVAAVSDNGQWYQKTREILGDRLAESIASLLREDSATLEAAATSAFFRIEA